MAMNYRRSQETDEVFFNLSFLSPQISPTSIYSRDSGWGNPQESSDRSRRVEELGIVEALLKENKSLRQEIVRHQKMWVRATDVVEKAIHLCKKLETLLNDCEIAEERAERGWLAYWGIHT